MEVNTPKLSNREFALSDPEVGGDTITQYPGQTLLAWVLAPPSDRLQADDTTGRETG
jgi:hypothetical protein